MEVLAVISQIEDGIADELAGAVVGALAAAVDFDDGVRKEGGLAETGLVPGAADGVDRMVFEEEEGGVGRSVEEAVDLRLLFGEGLFVGEGSEMLDVEEHCFRGGLLSVNGCLRGHRRDAAGTACRRMQQLRSDLFAGNGFLVVGVTGEEVGEADGEGVGGVVGRCFGETEEGADHEGDLLFISGAFADHSLLYLGGSIFEDAESVGGGSDEGGAPGGTHGDGSAMGLDVDDAFHGDFIGFPFLDEVSEGGGDGGECLGLREFLRDGDHAEVE